MSLLASGHAQALEREIRVLKSVGSEVGFAGCPTIDDRHRRRLWTHGVLALIAADARLRWIDPDRTRQWSRCGDTLIVEKARLDARLPRRDRTSAPASVRAAVHPDSDRTEPPDRCRARGTLAHEGSRASALGTFAPMTKSQMMIGSSPK